MDKSQYMLQNVYPEVSVLGNYLQVVLPLTGVTLNSESESCRAFYSEWIYIGPIAVG